MDDMYQKIAAALRGIEGVTVLMREDTEDFLLAWPEEEGLATCKVDVGILDDDDVEELTEHLDDLDAEAEKARRASARKPRARRGR